MTITCRPPCFFVRSFFQRRRVAAFCDGIVHKAHEGLAVLVRLITQNVRQLRNELFQALAGHLCFDDNLLTLEQSPRAWLRHLQNWNVIRPQKPETNSRASSLRTPNRIGTQSELRIRSVL